MKDRFDAVLAENALAIVPGPGCPVGLDSTRWAPIALVFLAVAARWLVSSLSARRHRESASAPSTLRRLAEGRRARWRAGMAHSRPATVHEALASRCQQSKVWWNRAYVSLNSRIRRTDAHCVARTGPELRPTRDSKTRRSNRLAPARSAPVRVHRPPSVTSSPSVATAKPGARSFSFELMSPRGHLPRPLPRSTTHHWARPVGGGSAGRQCLVAFPLRERTAWPTLPMLAERRDHSL